MKKDLGTSDNFTLQRNKLLEKAASLNIVIPGELSCWYTQRKTKEQYLSDLKNYIKKLS